MKSLLKKMIARGVHNDAVWSLLNGTILRFTRYMDRERYRQDNPLAEPLPAVDMKAELVKISPDLTVKHGVFKGMKYPSKEAAGSMLFPKIIGSYEREIQPLIERLCARPYTEIVDVGCAEGYYAVGLAMRIPTAKVYAFDINEQAIALCKRMAEMNGVADRVVTGSFCDPETLMSLPLTGRALVISDCEAYEKKLFTPEVAAFLAPHDVLVEVHDCLDINISSYLRGVFERTHGIEMVQSIDDIKKAQIYDYPEMRAYTLGEKLVLMREWRGSIMEWFCMSPRSHDDSQATL
jgi:SAM-dependent methyltransferase